MFLPCNGGWNELEHYWHCWLNRRKTDKNNIALYHPWREREHHTFTTPSAIRRSSPFYCSRPSTAGSIANKIALCEGKCWRIVTYQAFFSTTGLVLVVGAFFCFAAISWKLLKTRCHFVQDDGLLWTSHFFLLLLLLCKYCHEPMNLSSGITVASNFNLVVFMILCVFYWHSTMLLDYNIKWQVNEFLSGILSYFKYKRNNFSKGRGEEERFTRKQ